MFMIYLDIQGSWFIGDIDNHDLLEILSDLC